MPGPQGPQGEPGPQGPPGEGTGFDLAVLKELSWDPFEPQPARIAAQTLRELTFAFDRQLQPDILKRADRRAIEVWFSSDQPGSPVRSLHGTALIDAERVVWQIDDSDSSLVIEFGLRGGNIVIDLNCDILLDDTGQPVSSCWTGLFANHLPRPGGIMRTWLAVAPG